MEKETIVKGWDAQLVSRIVSYALPHKTIILFALAAMLFSTASELLLPLVLQRTIDGYILGPGKVEGIARGALFYLLLLASGLGFSFIETILIALAGQRVMKALRLDLFQHVLSRSLAYLTSQPTGRLVTRMTNDVETVNELFTSVITNLTKDIFLMAGVIIVLFSMNPDLAAVTILSLPPVFVTTVYFRKRARTVFRQVRLGVSLVNTFLSEHISGMKIIQLFTREEITEREFASHNNSLMKANLGEMYMFATFRPIIDFLGSFSLAVILYFGASRHFSGLLTLGTLVAFINLIRKFYQPVMDISEKYTILQSAMAGIERVFNILDDPSRISDTGGHQLQLPVQGRVEFRNVSFSYKEGEPVLKELNLNIEPGKTTAIVGYTGAGKTTVANLLTRLWDADEGTISLDGIDIKDLPLKSLRTYIQPIQQDVFLFNKTLRENISLGLDISHEKIVEAARSAQIHEFITALPDGYDTLIQEGAVNLSTGQRQLISFARILAHNPPVLILDEATSSIDTETEKLIQKALVTVLKGRTALVIAHRLSTIRDADQIFVFAGGRVSEMGTHDELIAQKGVYHALYRLQCDYCTED